MKRDRREEKESVLGVQIEGIRKDESIKIEFGG